MDKEKYIFEIIAQTDASVAKVKELEKHMDRLHKVNERGQSNNFTISQKDMSNSIDSLRILTTEINDVQRHFEEMQETANQRINIPTPINSTKTQRSEIESQRQASQNLHREAERNLRRLEEGYNRIKAQHKETAQYSQTPSRAFQRDDLRDSDTMFPESSRGLIEERNRERNRQTDIKMETRSVKQMGSRSESLHRSAMQTGYMSTAQHRTFQGDAQHALEVLPGRKEEHLQAVEELTSTKGKLQQEESQILHKDNHTSEDQQRLIRLRTEMKQFDDEIEARADTVNEIEKLNVVMKQRVQELEDSNTHVKPDRTTTIGMAYERAPSIGLGAIGAVTGVMASQYNKGGAIKDSIRGDVISQSIRTGHDNENRSFRKHAEQVGMDNYLGYTSSQVLDSQEQYISTAGFSTESDMDSATTQMLEFNRASGLGQEETQGFYEAMYGTGAIDASNIMDIQAGFVGAIKESGMEGREQEQIDALSTIVDQNSSNRDVTSREVKNIAGLQSALAGTGKRSLQGARGGELLSSMDEGIKGAGDNPMMSIIFGMGTDFQGLEGKAEMEKMLEGGISDPRNMEKIGQYIEGANVSDNVEQMMLIEVFKEMGQDISYDQSEGLLELMKSGDLTEDKLNELIDVEKGIGEDNLEDSFKKYLEMTESADNQADSVKEKQQAGLNDAGDTIQKVIAGMGFLSPVVYAVITALITFTATLALASASMMVSGGLRGLMGGRVGRAGGRMKRAGGKVLGRAKKLNPFSKKNRLPKKHYKPAGAPPNKGGHYNPAGRPRWGDPKPYNPPHQQPEIRNTKGQPGNKTPVEAPKGTGGNALKSIGRKGLGLLGLPLEAIALGKNLKEDKETGGGNKGKIVGESVGMGGGAVAGGKAGAVIGTMIAPGIGTAIGGLIGSIGGAFTGSKLGKKVGENFDEPDAETKAKIEESNDVLENGNIIEEMKNPDSDIDVKKSGVSINTGDSKAMERALFAQTDLASTSPQAILALRAGKESKGGDGTPGSLSDQTEDDIQNEGLLIQEKRQANAELDQLNNMEQEKILREANNILVRASKQNGIIGLMSLSGANGALGAGGENGGSGLSGDAEALLTQDLGFSDDVTAEELDAWIDAKAPKDSVLRGMGDAFLQAGNESGLDPRYLLAHSAHETGWGTSGISRDKGNVYGIGAFDASPYESAFSYDDTSAGIIAGAGWIKDNYYDKGQNTLQSMRHNNGKHEYASDPLWDKKIADTMVAKPGGMKSSGVSVASNVTVTARAGETLSDAVAKSGGLSKLGRDVSNAIHQQQAFHAKDMVRR